MNPHKRPKRSLRVASKAAPKDGLATRSQPHRRNFSCLHFLWLATVISVLYGCRKPVEVVPPKEAESAVAIARSYALTNGWKDGLLKAVTLRNGIWQVQLTSREARSDADYVLVRVSEKGEVISYHAPR